MLKQVIRNAAIRIFGALFRFFPIKNDRVVFDNFNGNGFGCNPKYIAEALSREKADLVWLAKKNYEDFPSYIRVLKYDSPSAWFALSTAKVFVTNVRNFKGIKKREGQFYIQTWHCALGPKKIERDAESDLLAQYIVEAKRNGADTDLMFADNDIMKHVFQESFWYGGRVIKCGVPRNKPLLHPDTQRCDDIKKSLGISPDQMICLYAPTWRSHGEVPVFDVHKLLNAIQDRFKRQVVLAIRLHPNTRHNPFKSLPFVVDADTVADSQELISTVDIVISDYSSIVEDAIIAHKPVFMFVPDLENYLSNRQFYYPLESRPCPLCKNEDELLTSIKGFSYKDYEAGISSFEDEFCLEDDGYGAHYIANIIRKKIEPKK